MRHVLVVDDERETAESMAMLIADAGYTVSTAQSLSDARRQIALQKPDLVVIDLTLPDGNGMKVFEGELLQPDTDVVFVTGHGDVESSIKALRLGALDYLLKPIDANHLLGLLARVSRNSHAAPSRRQTQLLGSSAAMRQVHECIQRVAGTSVAVLITGESGCGKELVAQTLHRLSRRSDKPMLTVNCGAISPPLMESELFGHERGSFTGAIAQHAGLFERADGGTLFLDEVTEMPIELQVKLLRVLETGSFLRVGASQTVTTDVRVLAATNRDPLHAVESGKLREDLLYRPTCSRFTCPRCGSGEKTSLSPLSIFSTPFPSARVRPSASRPR